jgi:hypothetical protein
MRHFQHPDELLFSQYSTAALAVILEAALRPGELKNHKPDEIRVLVCQTATLYAETMLAQHRRRFPLSTMYMDESNIPPSDIISMPVPKMADFRKIFADGEVPPPQWVNDAVRSAFISDIDKKLIYKYLVDLIGSRQMNVVSGSLKGAFDWAEAPGGFNFWSNIAQWLPVVPDDIPAKLLP